MTDEGTRYFKSYSNLLTLSYARHQGHRTAARVKPELALNSFDTGLGHRLGSMLTSLFYQDPQHHDMHYNGFHAMRQGHGRAARAKPELVLNNFDTRLGHRLGRMFASLFHQDPSFRSRQVATLHNQRDFIFFRYIWRVPCLSISSSFFKSSGKPSPAPRTSFDSLRNERCASMEMQSRAVSQVTWIAFVKSRLCQGRCWHGMWPHKMVSTGGSAQLMP